MSLADMQHEYDMTLSAINEIKSQLDEAAAIAAETGEYADSKWWVSANAALRHKARRIQELQRIMADIRRGERRTHSEARGQRFIEAARRILDKETWDELWRAADDGQ